MYALDHEMHQLQRPSPCICKNLDDSYFSPSLKGQIMVGTMEDGGYAINGKLWKMKKGYKQQRIACI
jgi:hypothetical protein